MTGTFNFRETGGIDLSKLRDAVAESLFYLDELIRTGGPQSMSTIPETSQIFELLEQVSDASNPMLALALTTLEEYTEETRLGELDDDEDVPRHRVLH